MQDSALSNYGSISQTLFVICTPVQLRGLEISLWMSIWEATSSDSTGSSKPMGKWSFGV